MLIKYINKIILCLFKNVNYLKHSLLAYTDVTEVNLELLSFQRDFVEIKQ